MKIIMPNVTTMITASNLHKMHLILGDDKCWVKAYNALILSIPPIMGKGSTTQTIVKAPSDMIVAQSHALLLKEMRKVHVHIIDKPITKLKCIETILTNLLVLKMDIERDFTSFMIGFRLWRLIFKRSLTS